MSTRKQATSRHSIGTHTMSTHSGASTPHLRWAALVAAILIAVWLLAACSSSSDSAGESADSRMYDPSAAMEDMAVEGVVDEATTYSADRTTQETGGDRSVIVTGSMFMTVDNPTEATARAVSIVTGAGGRIDGRSETAPSDYDGGAAWLTLRIPADALDTVIDDLRELGTVDELNTSARDVTVEVTDLEAQISTLRASTERIQGLLDQAEKIEDIIALETELDSRRSELESLEARQRGLDDQVSMSTLELSLTTEPAVPVDDNPDSFWGGLQSGWESLVAFVSGSLVVTGVLLPWLAVAAVLAGIVILAVRKRRRTRATS